MSQDNFYLFATGQQSLIRSFSGAISFALIFFLLALPLFVAAGEGPEDYAFPYEATKKISNYLTTRDQTGAFIHAVSIEVPPGRNGLQPDLELAYSSRETEVNNIFGYGWTISIPYIQRINREGAESLYSDFYFYSSLDGELATTTSATTTFAARIENGDFRSYNFENNVWTVYDKQGTQYSFGSTTASRQDDPGDSSKVYTWYLAEIRDTNDNYITYEYDKDNGQVYPSQITYTGHGTTEGIFTVDFLRTSRTDTATSTTPGFDVISKEIVDEINVKIDGDLTRKYEMSHTTGDNGARLVVDTITETGYTEGGTPTALPAMTFSYQEPERIWTLDEGYSVPVDFNENVYDLGVVIADVNGDALPDLIQSVYWGTTTQGVYINDGDGTGWTEDVNYTIPELFADSSDDRGVRVFDVNGDGFVDIVKASQSGPTTTSSVYINDKDGTGWTLDSNYTVPIAFVLAPSGEDRGVRITDVNGDGLPDLMRAWNNNGGTTIRAVYINDGDGTGWTEDANYTVPVDFTTQVYDEGVRLMDVNGDGFVDLVQAFQPSSDLDPPVKGVYINNGDGTGWTEDTRYSIPITFVRDPSKDLGVRVFDVNGDNLPDLLQSLEQTAGTTTAVYINDGDGTGWTQDTVNYNVPIPFQDEDSGDGVRITDVDGDGRDDIVRAWADNVGGHFREVHISGDYRADLVQRVDLPTGASITASYKNTPEYLDGSSIASPQLPLLLTTVEAIGRDDGFGNTSTTTYSYGGGLFYFEDPYERRFAGFATTTTTDATGNVTKEYAHQGNASNSSQGEYSDHKSKIGKVYRTEEYDDSSNLYRKTITKWDRENQDDNRDFVERAQVVTFSYDGDGDHRDKAESFTYSTTTGNLTEKIEWGEVTGSDNGSFSDTDNDKRTTDISYATDGSHIVGLPSQETLTDENDETVKETKHYYDGLSFGNVDKGNETTMEQWKKSSSYIDTQYAYNSYGLMASSTDPRGKVTDYEYDPYNLYPATTTDPVGNVVERTYDYSSGNTKLTIDPNGLYFETTYDGLDRPLTETQPDLTTPPTSVTKKTYSYTDTAGIRKTLETNYLDGSVDFTLYTYFDGLDRKIQTRKEAETASEFSVKDFMYDERGLLYRESLPYFSTGSATTTATTTTALYSTHLYDALERVTEIGTAVGTTTYAYDQWTATTTDPEGNERGHENDAHGNLARVTEKKDTSYYVTEYAYYADDNLATTTDAEGNVRHFEYDGLDRRIIAEDLHDPGNGTFGTWNYEYDDAGNLATSTDPKGQVIKYTYDDVNRVLTEDYAGEGGIEVSYAYDSCAYGKPRLCTATTTDAVTTYSYNALGLVDEEIRTINSDDYTTSYDYDRQGNLTGIVYPDASEVAYTYNTAGLLESIDFKENGGAFADIITDFDYAPTEKVTFKLFGNDVESTYTYDANNLYRLTNIFTIASTTEGGGGMGMLGGLWSTLVRLADPLPLAVQATVLGEEDLLPKQDTVTTTSEEESDAESAVEDNIEETAVATSTEELELVEENKEEPPTEEVEDSEGVVLGASTSTEEVIDPQEENEVPVSTTTPTSSVSEETVTSSEGVALSEETTSQVEEEASQKELIEGPSTTVKDVPAEAQKGLYTEKSDRYELPVTQRLSGSKDAKVEILKDQPEVRLKKWDGEVDLGVSYANVQAEASLDDSNEKVEWKGENEEVHAYPLAAGEAMEDGGFEIEVYLKEKPASNIFNFTLDGTENLEFWYQPSLTEEALDGQTCTDTECTDEEGNITTSRPENVVGSYAVYRKETSGRKTGATNYATGKAFHIYRPKAIDADGNETWGVLTYESNTLSVEIPEEFLNTAVYPVRVDPTFGYTSLGSSAQDIADYFSDDNERAGHTETLAEAGTLDSLHAGLSISSTLSGNQTVSITVFVNEENTSTDSHDEVASVDEDKVITSTSPAWFTFTASSESLAADDYILSVVGDGSDMYGVTRAEIAYDSTGSRNNYYEDFTGSYASAQEDPWTETDSSGSRKYSIYATYTASGGGNDGPSAPTSLETEGQTNPTNISDSTPEFTAIYNDPDEGDIATDYQIQVATSTNFASPYWDSTKTTLASSTPEGTRIDEISYGGSALASSTTYYWRIKFWDDDDAEGDWSTATSTFSLAEEGGGGNELATILQDISFEYDDVGNITDIFDYSDTGAGKVVEFEYDELNRLINAATTAASSTSFDREYQYSSIGNITAKAGVSYTYSETGYANPHAATQIGSTVYAYDENGNVTNAGTWVYTWDYRNRLVSSGDGTATTTYGYDHENQRVLKTAGGITTAYPNQHFNVADATSTAHILTPVGDLVATVELAETEEIEGGSGDTGWKTAGTVEDNTGWDNLSVSSLASSDDDRADCDPICDNSDVAEVSDFDFGIPSGATIDGIEVRWECYGDATTSLEPQTSLSWDNGSNFTSVVSSPSCPSNSDGTITYGGSTDTWGRSWDDSEFADGTFLLKFDKESSSRTLNIDHLQVKVYYTESSQPGAISTTTRFIHTDHLGGTNVVSDENGLVDEVVDYYPYGTQRISETFNATAEQRKFTGHEYDEESDLTYAKARYYDQDIGRFLSQDPVSLHLTEAILPNPQLLNMYSYSNNNPIGYSDPSGLLTVGIAGTWNEGNSGWTTSNEGSSFLSSIEKTFGEQPQLLNWSGGDNNAARTEAATSLASLVNNHSFADGEKLNIIGHSHGGNVAIEASNMGLKHRIDNLVTLGTPVRSDYQPNYDMIGNHINVYSSLDVVQFLGGGQFDISSSRVGPSQRRYGEFGPTWNRTYGGANNINATFLAGDSVFDLPSVHGNLWRNTGIWADVDAALR